MGGPGYRVTNSATGRRYRTIGLPGTGLYHVKELNSAGGADSAGSGGGGSGTDGGRAESQQGGQAGPPALFAPKGERVFHEAIVAQDFARIERVIYEYPEYSVPAAAIVGGWKMADGDLARAGALLDWVLRTGQDPAAHPFVQRYVHSAITVGLAPGVMATLPVSRDATGLMLAEIYQSQGKSDEAISAVESVNPTTYAAVSLAELYIEAGRLDDVIEITDGIENVDDATAFLLLARGAALREKGLFDASRGALREALKSKKRAPEVRHRALMERARTYAAEGKKAMARKDLERIIAEDSRVEGVAEMLAELEK